MADDLEARLQSHSKAFDGLMSLIPADIYFGKDNDDQWQRKKQTKEEKRAAKRAKLDPNAYKSALDVHREMERKRKRELGESSELSDQGDSKEQPKEGLIESRKSLKKQKLNSSTKNDKSKVTKVDEPAQDDESVRRKAKAAKRKEKREQKQAKKARKLEKAELKKLQKKSESQQDVEDASLNQAAEVVGEDEAEEEDDAEQDQTGSNDVERIDFDDGGGGDAVHSSSSRSPSPALEVDTPTFSHSHNTSSASSTSSLNAPTETDSTKPQTQISSPEQTNQTPAEPSISTAQKSLPKLKVDTETTAPTGAPPSAESEIRDSPSRSGKSTKLPPINQELLRERLAARIAALRAQRNADGLDGKPARNRAELIEARRRKEEARRETKKELRKKAKEQDAEAEAARLRGGSGSPLWSSPGVFGPAKTSSNSFSFGRVAFDDGTQVDSSLSAITDPKKKKGPQDPRTALEAAEKKKSRLSGLDEQKRADIEEKDRWLNAKKRVQGEKVRDDTSLLKKALKRKQKGKEKSEKAWNERNEGVQKSIHARQAKREENLAKRKNEKNAKKGGARGPSGPTKPKKRPGFEGSFKTGRRGMD